MSISDLVPWNWGKRNVQVRRREDPFYDLQRRMNELFSGFMEGFGVDTFPDLEKTFAGFSPSVDVKESDSQIVVKADLPGLTQDQVNINLTDDSLIIRGEKREEKEEKDERQLRHYTERSYGSFQRVIPLTSEIVADKVDASFKNGVLTVILPKSDQSRKNVRKVSVRSE